MDNLLGLKENVIMGHLIPAGTGMAFHRARKDKEENEAAEREALAALVVPADRAGFVCSRHAPWNN